MKTIRDEDCPIPNAYYMDSSKVGTFPVEPGTVIFSNERFEVSGEGKELKSFPTDPNAIVFGIKKAECK